MTHPPSTTPPGARWRIPFLGSLFAVLVLVLGVLVAPAAGAAPAAPSVPDLGSVGRLTVDLDSTGSVPLGTSLSGIGVRFTSSTAQGTCLADATGGCTISWTSGGVTGSAGPVLRLPTGIYTVTQPADLAHSGLRPQAGDIATVQICDCSKNKSLRIVNESLYRNKVTGTVVDAATQLPISFTGFTLSGPGVVLPAFDTSDKDGRLSFTAPLSIPFLAPRFFQPGEWTLTPVGLPAKYAAPVTLALTADDVSDSALLLGTVPLGPPAAKTGSVTVTVAATGSFPDGIDLSGAAFEFVDAGGEVAGTCTTTASAGSCSLAVVPVDAIAAPLSSGTLPAGSYSVRQTAAPTGLMATSEIPDQKLCVSTDDTACATTVPVSNASLYRTSVQAEVTSAGVAAEDVTVTLTGPGYEAVPASTDDAGLATWTGWFLPGDWTFAVEGETEPRVEVLTTDADQVGEPWKVTITLVPETGGDTGGGTGGDTGGGTGGDTGGGTGGDTGGGTGGDTGGGTGGTGGETGGGTGGTGGTGGETGGGTGEETGGLGSEGLPVTPTAPTTTPASPTTVAPSTPAKPTPATPTAAKPSAGGATSEKPTTPPVAPSPAGTNGTTPVTGGYGTSEVTGGSNTSPTATEPTPETQPEATPSAAAPTGAPSAGGGSSSGGGSSVTVAEEAPELRTESSTQMLNVGVVTGLGILFLAVVLTGYAVLRSRARRRVY